MRVVQSYSVKPRGDSKRRKIKLIIFVLIFAFWRNLPRTLLF